MPVLIVYGMPHIPPGGAATDQILEGLVDDLQKVAAQVLNLHKEEISVFLPRDLVNSGLGKELVCMVEGLFEKPERTIEVRQQLAESIKSALYYFAQEYLPSCPKIEVLVKRFNQDVDGFAVYHGLGM